MSKLNALVIAASIASFSALTLSAVSTAEARNRDDRGGSFFNRDGDRSFRRDDRRAAARFEDRRNDDRRDRGFQGRSNGSANVVNGEFRLKRNDANCFGQAQRCFGNLFGLSGATLAAPPKANGNGPAFGNAKGSNAPAFGNAKGSNGEPQGYKVGTPPLHATPQGIPTGQGQGYKTGTPAGHEPPAGYPTTGGQKAENKAPGNYGNATGSSGHGQPSHNGNGYQNGHGQQGNYNHNQQTPPAAGPNNAAEEALNNFDNLNKKQ